MKHDTYIAEGTTNVQSNVTFVTNEIYSAVNNQLSHRDLSSCQVILVG